MHTKAEHDKNLKQEKPKLGKAAKIIQKEQNAWDSKHETYKSETVKHKL